MRLGDMIASALALLLLTSLAGGIFLVFGRPLWRERFGQMGIVAKSPRHGGTDDAGRLVFCPPASAGRQAATSDATPQPFDAANVPSGCRHASAKKSAFRPTDLGHSVLIE